MYINGPGHTAWPINVNGAPWEGGKSVYIIGPGHMTKMAAMPIYGKNLQTFLT